jgi:hypothetical protein
MKLHIAVWLSTASLLVALSLTPAVAQEGPDRGGPAAGPQAGGQPEAGGGATGPQSEPAPQAMRTGS